MIDLDRLWDIVAIDLPPLVAALDALILALDPPPAPAAPGPGG